MSLTCNRIPFCSVTLYAQFVFLAACIAHVQVLQSIESDLKRYQQSVTIIGTSQDDANVRDDLVEIRTTIKNKLTTASTDIAQQKQT